MSKKFYFLWASQILSQVTINIMNFLLLTRLFDITHSSIATSLLWVTYALPTIFFGPIGAGFADLISRRKTLMITNLLQALVVFLYIFTHEYSIFLLFAVIILYSFLNQFYVPAEMATLPSIIPEKKLAKANSLFFLTQQLSLIVGFGFAGIIQNWVGFEGSLMICAGALFVAFISVSFLPKLNPINKVPKNWENIISVFSKHIIEGYKFIKNHNTILYPLGLLFLIQVGLTIVTSNLPIIAEEILNVPSSLSGLYIVVPAGIGATIASILIPRIIKRGWRKKKIIEISLGIIALSVLSIIFGKLVTTPIFVVLAGMGFVGINIPALTFLQESTPDWLRGRVFGNLSFLISISTIFPVIFSGVISEFLGVKTLLTILSFGVILVLTFSMRRGQKLIENNINNGKIPS